MDEVSKKKMRAAGKIVFGVYELGSSALMATGHGLIGHALKNHNMMGLAMNFARRGAAAGQKSLAEGLRDWENAK